MSTIPLLPPERSHICMAFGSALWAQALAGSGVGTAAAALADAAGADAAGADAAGGDDAPVPPDGALDDVVEEQAANSKIAMNARAGNLKRLLIPCSSSSNPPGRRDSHCCRCPARGTVARAQTSVCIRLQ